MTRNEHLSNLIPSLPKLRQDVDQLLAECQKDLSVLPSAITGEATTQVFSLITKFCDDFRAAVFGERHKILVQTSRERYAQFKSDIYATRPNFRPFVDRGESGNFAGAPISLADVQSVIARYAITCIP
jgi:hypothetical protein